MLAVSRFRCAPWPRGGGGDLASGPVMGPLTGFTASRSPGTAGGQSSASRAPPPELRLQSSTSRAPPPELRLQSSASRAPPPEPRLQSSASRAPPPELRLQSSALKKALSYQSSDPDVRNPSLISSRRSIRERRALASLGVPPPPPPPPPPAGRAVTAAQIGVRSKEDKRESFDWAEVMSNIVKLTARGGDSPLPHRETKG
ncbi:unnamed protein product [Lota lota]